MNTVITFRTDIIKKEIEIMRDDLTLEEIVTPYYEQIKQLGEMREDYILPYSYLRKLFRHFFTECLYELKYSRKLERRFTRKDYRKQKREINALFKKAFLPVKAEKPETDETPQKKESKAVAVKEDSLPE